MTNQLNCFRRKNEQKSHIVLDCFGYSRRIAGTVFSVASRRRSSFRRRVRPSLVVPPGKLVGKHELWSSGPRLVLQDCVMKCRLWTWRQEVQCSLDDNTVVVDARRSQESATVRKSRSAESAVPGKQENKQSQTHISHNTFEKFYNKKHTSPDSYYVF